MFKASKTDQADSVYLLQILQAVKCYCLHPEKTKAGIETPRQFRHAKEAWPRDLNDKTPKLSHSGNESPNDTKTLYQI